MPLKSVQSNWMLATMSSWTCSDYLPCKFDVSTSNSATCFKIVHGLCYFPPDVVVQNTNFTHSSMPLILHQSFSRMNHFYHSFIPSAVRTWNNLPEYIVCAPNYTSFRTPLRCFSASYSICYVICVCFCLLVLYSYGYTLSLA